MLADVDRHFEGSENDRAAFALEKALMHHGVETKDGFFAPHTRGFDWEPFRVR